MVNANDPHLQKQLSMKEKQIKKLQEQVQKISQ